MFNSPFLDGVIAMIVLYLLFSQLTLSLVELPAGFFNWRGRYLHQRLADTLGPQAHEAFYEAATIRALMLPPNQKNWLLRPFIKGWPAYISEPLFAQTVVGLVSARVPVATPPRPAIAQFEEGRKTLAAGQFKDLLATLYHNATATAMAATATATATAVVPPEAQSAALQKNLEAWFHEYGERMTGWYKRDNRKYLFLAGLLVALLADVDTGRLGRFIFDSNNAKARVALAEAGVRTAQGPAPTEPGYNPALPRPTGSQAAAQHRFDSLLLAARQEFRSTLAAVPAVGLPLGWLRWTNTTTVAAPADTTTKIDSATGHRTYAKPASYAWAPAADDFGMPAYAQRWTLDEKTGQVGHPAGWSWWPTIGGWLLTGLALMLGAPFWFDTLCRFVNVRNIGIKPAAVGK